MAFGMLVSACNKVCWMAVEVMVHSVSREATFGFRVSWYPIIQIFNQLKGLKFAFGFMGKAVKRLPNRLVSYQGVILEQLCHAS